MSKWKILAIVGSSLAGIAITYAKQKWGSSDQKQQAHSLGRFVIWGRPNSGKTTFITHLLGKVPSHRKEATDSKKKYSGIILDYLTNGPYVIEEIFDMPGNTDRHSEWLEMVVNREHVFYLVDLSRLEDLTYFAEIKLDIELTVDAIDKSEKQDKRINFIATHLDESKWKDIDKANVNKEINKDITIRQLSEFRKEVKGVLYSVNLTEKPDFQKLMQDIVNDISN